MTSFAIARYGPDDYRLVKYDGDSETEIGSGWSERPGFEACLEAIADHHAVGNTPFSSRDGMIDAHVLTTEWPLATRDLTLDDETLPWND